MTDEYNEILNRQVIASQKRQLDQQLAYIDNLKAQLAARDASDAATIDHIGRVRENMRQIINRLMQQSERHDASKMIEPERSGYAALHNDMLTVAYGTPEYAAVVEKHKPTVAHHYMCNSHHPECYEKGVREMDMFDILEMLADWKAASERPTSKTSFSDGFMHNRDRFNIPDDLFQMMIYTVEALGWADILG